MYGHEFFWGGGLVMLLLWGLVLAGAGVLVYVVVRMSRDRSHLPPAPPAPPATAATGHGGPASSPRAILEERYARGEIDTAEFTERRRTLDES